MEHVFSSSTKGKARIEKIYGNLTAYKIKAKKWPQLKNKNLLNSYSQLLNDR
jgi:hypothetical protein